MTESRAQKRIVVAAQDCVLVRQKSAMMVWVVLLTPAFLVKAVCTSPDPELVMTEILVQRINVNLESVVPLWRLRVIVTMEIHAHSPIIA